MAANDGGIFTAPTTTSTSEKSREFGFNPLHKQVVKGMWIASILVEIRSIYRTIEFSMGVEGYLFQHEWPLWVFEAVPMWLALLVLGIYHPAKWLQQKRRSAFLDKSDRRVAQAGGVDLGLPK
ncbi:hypothetical protein LTR05_002952 [Lithohypha guttulata]|uniref:Uncharacterized protein n=1 Tax=Lithohypha guttulata TaxID=1690604 RepID=A0AAN7T3E7_9EURO|nr:hypothetical protein LTR05_002952 [Lithohypha guttulata]